LHRGDGMGCMRGNRRGNDKNVEFDLPEQSLDIIEIRSRFQAQGQFCAETGLQCRELVLGPLVGDGSEIDVAGSDQRVEGAQMDRAVSEDAGNRYPNRFLGWRTHEGYATVKHVVSVSATADGVKSSAAAEAILSPRRAGA